MILNNNDFRTLNDFILNKEDVNDGLNQIKNDKKPDEDNFETFKLSNLPIKNKNNININNEQTLTEQQTLETEYNQLLIKNKELNLSKEKLKDEIKQQARNHYISSNFDKIDKESVQDLDILNKHFDPEGYPQINLKNYRVATNKTQMENIINEAQSFKNIYNPGDIVTDNSSFNITRDNICYRSNGKPMKVTKDFKEKYPQCMVCNTISQDELKDSDSWRNTKTNIKEVCLFNPNTTNNSGIPNLDQCKKMCNI